MNDSPPRFFLLRPGALGDTLLLAPALAALKARLPGTWIALAAQAGAGRLLAGVGLVDQALSRDDPRLAALFGTSGRLDDARASLGSLDGAVAWLGDPDRLVERNLVDLGARHAVVAPSRPPPGSGVHVAEYLARALAGMAGPLVLPAGPFLAAAAGDLAWAESFLASAGSPAGPVVTLHPGSGSDRKNWSAEGFAAVADALGARSTVVILGGLADEAAVGEVLKRVRTHPLVATDLPLPRVAGLLARSVAYLGNDSGLTHLAALLGVPTVALFGPTDPALWRPWGRRVTVLEWGTEGETLAAPAVVEAVLATMVSAM
ncbi:MAG: glycosyltransferase family 9 protein [Chloroflexota bacterium]